MIKEWINYNQVDTFHNSFSNVTSDAVFATAVSLFPIGAFIGCLVGACLANRFGRLRTLQVNTSGSVLGSLLMALSYIAKFYPMFHLGRFVTGLSAGRLGIRYAYLFALGVGSTVAPLYVTELSPIRYRGTFGSLAQLSGVVSVLVSQVLGLKAVLGASDRWNWIFSKLWLPLRCPKVVG